MIDEMACLRLQGASRESMWLRSSTAGGLCPKLLLLAEQSHTTWHLLSHGGSMLRSILLQSVFMVSHISNTFVAQVRLQSVSLFPSRSLSLWGLIRDVCVP